MLMKATAVHRSSAITPNAEIGSPAAKSTGRRPVGVGVYEAPELPGGAVGPVQSCISPPGGRLRTGSRP